MVYEFSLLLQRGYDMGIILEENAIIEQHQEVVLKKRCFFSNKTMPNGKPQS